MSELRWVTGADDEYATDPVEPAAEPDYDASATATPETFDTAPPEMFDSGVPAPDYPSEAPVVEPTEVELGPDLPPHTETAANLEATFDAGDTQGSATPARLNQGQIADCFLVSSLNEIASAPGGMDHLDSLVVDVGHGFHEVTLRSADGTASTVLVRDPEITNGSIPPNQRPGTGDPTLQILEKAMAVHNDRTPDIASGMTPESIYQQSEINRGGVPADAMKQLWLRTESLDARDTLAAFKASPEDAYVLGTNSLDELRKSGDVRAVNQLAADFKRYGLHDSHGYEIQSMYRDRKGNDMVVLRNPWGVEHPKDIPASVANRLFAFGNRGVIPR